MASHPKIYGVIPARYESSRLPGKALRDVAGKPLIQRVYEAASVSPLLDEVLVATDSDAIADFCQSGGIPVIKTGQHRSGTDRVHEVMKKTDAEVYANIQGDEPTIRPEHLDALLLPLFDPEIRVTTLKVKIDSRQARDPNEVKIVTDLEGRALYFSRQPIPFDQAGEGKVQYYKHLGLYAYRREALELFFSLPQSPLELTERLEQLRFLENGVPIHVGETPFDTIGVDTEEDLRQAESLFQNSMSNGGEDK